MRARRRFDAKNMDAGLEGDKTFYFGEHAVLMRGPVDIDLDVQPPPDLAIEVEVSHSADAALVAWGRLGVPEVWRFQPKSSQFSILCPEAMMAPYSPIGAQPVFPARFVGGRPGAVDSCRTSSAPTDGTSNSKRGSAE